jgi:hypothetical protein
MPNRYVRDELIMIALDQVSLPNLKVHEAPDGIVRSDAYSIQWLQDILDFWYHMVPFSATVGTATVTCTPNSHTVTLPADFILDVRNGYTVQAVPGDATSMRRTLRLPLQRFINRRLQSQRVASALFPLYYCVVGDDEVALTQYQIMQVSPAPSIATVGQLWYYKLPPVLTANTKPKFPNDYACIEYLKIRMLEWAHLFDPGTAQKFCDKIVGGMKAAGLMNEPEDDEIPMDTEVYRRPGSGAGYGWMGPL